MRQNEDIFDSLDAVKTTERKLEFMTDLLQLELKETDEQAIYTAISRIYAQQIALKDQLNDLEQKIDEMLKHKHQR